MISRSQTVRSEPGSGSGWRVEALGIAALAAMVVYFIAVSWRKWPDAITDDGPQWYALWRLTLGARLYHDVVWNYGPLSASFVALLFKLFGPGMMVLATANLVIYTAIVSLAYLLFRKAWGWMGTFCGLAVFIAVFSFSRLNSVANYNYATPYANESTHGMVLILLTLFVAVWWQRGPSIGLAFALGLCGGIAIVLKPEFMLTGCAAGALAWIARGLQRQRVGAKEYLAILAGLALPTLLFALRFARGESLKQALIDASQAWWLVLVNRSQATSYQQQLFLGLDKPWDDAANELKAGVSAAVVLGAVWAGGWASNWKGPVKWLIVFAAAALAILFLPLFPTNANPGPWLGVGSGFPVLILTVLAVLAWRAWRELKGTGRIAETTFTALALTVVALCMLARMLLRARIHHLGFYQAALAGMVIAAFIVVEIPKWTGGGAMGRRLAAAVGAAILAVGCISIAMESHSALADQTLPEGTGRDQFYASDPDVDATGRVVNWVLDYLKTVPPDATVCVLPEGEMINYLSRQASPIGAARSEQEMVSAMDLHPPDYIVFISRDFSETGVKEYGAPGGPGYQVKVWMLEHKYAPVASTGGNPLRSDSPKGAVILRRPVSVHD